MRIITVVEASIVVAILVLAYTSLAHDHEGEWVNVATGEHFMIQPGDGWTATSSTRKIALTRSHVFAPFVGDGTGTYHHGGRIAWQSVTAQGVPAQPDRTWRRFADGVGQARLNWRHAYNLTRSWTVAGEWVGWTGTGSMIYLQISTDGGEIKVSMLNGQNQETLHAEPTAAGGVKMTNGLQETFMFSWDGATRGTLEVNNHRVTVDRLAP